MRAKTHFLRNLRITVLGTWLFGGMASLLAVPVPVLTIEDDVAGKKLSWDAMEGRDYVLQGSDDGQTWTDMGLSVLQPDGTGPYYVQVPTLKARKFYQLFSDGGTTTQAAYVGPDKCASCHRHESTFDDWRDGGHPHKLNKVVNGQAPEYFSTNTVNVPNPPAGVSWSDVSYVIGGAIWKARFIDQNGYIITGTDVQFNLDPNPGDSPWANYHPEDARGTKPYDCGSCHTTGWVAAEVPDGPDGGVHQDGMEGMWGSFADSAITCEACHGPGSRHTDGGTSPRSDAITIDTSAEMCGRCHNRGGVNSTILASGGFIRHHEQYNEMESAGHGSTGAAHGCVTCHDPHKSVKVGAKDGIHTVCTDCHNANNPAPNTPPHNFANNNHTGDATCTDCHMPRASKSAVAVNQFVGDIQTHIFKINPSATGEMFTTVGEPPVTTANGSTGVTLSYVCYQCHEDPISGEGGSKKDLSLGELAAEAGNYHGISP